MIKQTPLHPTEICQERNFVHCKLLFRLQHCFPAECVYVCEHTYAYVCVYINMVKRDNLPYKLPVSTVTANVNEMTLDCFYSCEIT